MLGTQPYSAFSLRFHLRFHLVLHFVFPRCIHDRNTLDFFNDLSEIGLTPSIFSVEFPIHLSMDLQISDKVALVTGGSKGIGLAVSQGLAAEGVRVVVCARDEAVLNSVISDIRSKGGEAFAIAADVSTKSGIEELFDKMESYTGLPDILVVNAGGPPPGTAADLTDDAWNAGYDLTLMSAVRLTRFALPKMQEQQWGRIINITSVSVKQPVANLALSNAFRAGVTGFAKTLSTEVANQGITVNNVGPGYTDTQRLNALFVDEEAKTTFANATIPAQRLATPEEVAAPVIFLASEQAAYITGQTISVDGGFVKGLL